MASRILAQLLVAAGAMVARAAVQAYRQAVINGQRSGVTAETIRKATSNQMQLQEARKILGIEDSAQWTDILKKYEHLMDVNKRLGSFYLQSKVYRAMERLEQEKQEDDKKQSGSNLP
eukprot:g8925.t1